MLDFFNEDFSLEIALKKWECVFSAKTGAFFINLLILVSSLRCQLELHRVGDLCILLFSVVKHFRSWEKREAARRKCEDVAISRN